MTNEQTWDEIFASHYTEPAEQVYCIAFTPRSGSTWLSQLIQHSNALGDPREYFSHRDRKYLISHSACHDVESYYHYLKIVRQSAGVFGFEIAYPHAAKLITEGHRQILDDVGTWFYLRRRDFIAQAVSQFRASSSGVYHSHQQSESLPATPYDASEIERIALALMAAEYNWNHYFHPAGLSPHELWYEDLMEMPNTEILQHFTQILGLDASRMDGISEPESPLERMSDGHSRYLIERFKQEHAPFVSYWNEQRGKITIKEYRESR